MAKGEARPGAKAAGEVVAGFRRRCGGQRRLHWYTRHHAWEVASKMYPERGSLEELNNEEVREVLERVNKHFVKHSEWCRGSTAWVEKDKGPRDAREFAESAEHGARVRTSGGELGEVLPHEYNGEWGGRVFKWFAARAFERELAKRGADRETCNERQATEALRATSAMLGENALWEKGRLAPFAGPQFAWHSLLSSVEEGKDIMKGTKFETTSRN